MMRGGVLSERSLQRKAMLFGLAFFQNLAYFHLLMRRAYPSDDSLMRKYRAKGVSFLPGVYLNEDDYSFDIALRRFKKQVEKAGILSEMKKRQHYEKPSVMRKKKKAAARKRLMKKIRKMNMG